MQLDLCNGPPCPRCGCRDSKIMREPDNGKSWWNAGQARCNHCGMGFTFMELPQEPAVVDEVPPAIPLQIAGRTIPEPTCPQCGGETRITSTRKGLRYHKCTSCGATMKTAKTAI